MHHLFAPSPAENNFHERDSAKRWCNALVTYAILCPKRFLKAPQGTDPGHSPSYTIEKWIWRMPKSPAQRSRCGRMPSTGRNADQDLPHLV